MTEEKDFKILSSISDSVVEMAVTGKLTELDVPVLQREINAHREAGHYSLLIDIRALDENYVYLVYHVRCPARAIGKTAVVACAEYEQLKSLCENLTKHTPLELKCFTNIDAAREWLQSKKSIRSLPVDTLFEGSTPHR